MGMGGETGTGKDHLLNEEMPEIVEMKLSVEAAEEKPTFFDLALPSRFKKDEEPRIIYDYFQNNVDPILMRHFSNGGVHNYVYDYETKEDGICFYVEIHALREKIIKVGKEIVDACDKILNSKVSKMKTDKN